MNGLVLLTEEQQRALASARDAPPARARPPPPRVLSAATSASHSSHRRSSLPSSDYSGRQGQVPRTDFTTPSQSSRGKASTTAASTLSGNSPRHTGYVRSELTRPAPADDSIHHDNSYPILRDDAVSFSSTGSSGDDRAAANRYAGTSSGLHISVTWTMVGVAAGVALGLLLSQLHVSPDAARWVSLPGDLFLRALKCLVIPYVFCAVAVAIGDIVFVGKVSVVGAQTFRMFALFWVSSAVIGMVIAMLFRPLFRLGSAPRGPAVHAMGFTCSNGQLFTVSTNGSIVCTTNPTTPMPQTSTFVVTDLGGTLTKVSSQSGITQLTLTEQLIAIVEPIVSKNITATLANGDVLSTITFAMVLGAIAGRNYFLKTRRVNYLYLTLLQLRNTFFLAMEWIIWLSPFAVVSIIAGAFATNENALRQFTRVYTYILAGLAAAILQMMVVFPLLVFLLTRCNPYHHMSKMLRAYMFAFACSSSLATAPITLTCVNKAKVCSQSLGNFVISIGVCSNLSAVGWYIPIAIVFIAESSGNGDQITLLRLVGVFVLSVLQCAGTAPIPSGVLVSVATIYTTIFGVASVPDTFAYVTAMDFLVDRFVTVCDVNDDIMCLKVIAENTDETVTQEHLGERE